MSKQPSELSKRMFAQLILAAIDGTLGLVQTKCAHTGRDLAVLVVMAGDEESGDFRATPPDSVLQR